MKYAISRPPLFAFMCAAFFAFLLAFPLAAWARDPYAPPGGISPTSARLDEVVAAAQKADGFDRPFSTSVREGRVTAWGLSGTFRSVVSGDDFKWSVNLGPLSWQNGKNSGQLWRENENGLVILLHDARNGNETNAEALALYRRHPSAELKLLGETAGASAAYVVEVRPNAGLLRWLFFDKKSYLLTRVEVPFLHERDVYTYSDFHKSASYMDAWHVHFSDGVTRNDLDYVTLSKRYNVELTQSETSIPLSNDKLIQFPPGLNVVNLPTDVMKMVGSNKILTYENSQHDITMPGSMTSTVSIQHESDPKILIKLNINGKGYDFYLDTGAPGIYIDSDKLAKIGVTAFGPSTQSAFGNWVPGYTLIPEIRVGDIKMTNVIANVLPSWHAEPSPGTEIVGLVGYDFIANAVLTIDYEKGTVTATNPFLFVPPADGISLPATFDDGYAYIPVQIGQASSDHFILDTGSPNCFLFSSFTDAHPDDVKDQGAGVAVNHLYLPWFGWEQVGGGELQVHATEVKSMTVGGILFNDWIMFRDLTKQSPGDYSAGLIGYDFLKYFTVYLDYQHNQVFLVPNSRTRNQKR